MLVINIKLHGMMFPPIEGSLCLSPIKGVNNSVNSELCYISSGRQEYREQTLVLYLP